MFCRQCGSEMESAAVFCTKCGTKVEREQSTPTPVQPTVANTTPTPVQPTVVSPAATPVQPTVVSPAPTPVQPTVVSPAPTPVQPTVASPAPTPVQPTVASSAPTPTPTPVQAAPVYAAQQAPDLYDQPMTIKGWIGTMIVMMIPVVNFIMLFVWAFGSNVNKSKKTYFQASLILALIMIVLSIVFGAALVAVIRTFIGDSMNLYY